MKKLIAIMVACSIFVLPFTIQAEEIDVLPSIDEYATCTVHMEQGSLTGGNSTSSIIRPHWNSSIGDPAAISSYTSSLNNIGSLTYRNTVTISVSSPNLSAGMVVYIGLYMGHCVTKFQVKDENITWSTNDNGYKFNGTWSSTNCSVDPSTFIDQYVPSSTFNPTREITRSGSEYVGLSTGITVSNISRSTPYVDVPGIPGAGSGLYQGWYYPTTTGTYRLFKVVVPNTAGVDYDTLRITFTDDQASGFKIKTGSTGYYCTPVVAMPIFMCFPTTPSTQDKIVEQLDEIMGILSGSIDIGIDLQPLLDAIGDTSTYTVMSRLIQITTHLSNIRNLLHSSGSYEDDNGVAAELINSIDLWLREIAISTTSIIQEQDEEIGILYNIEDWLENIFGILSGTAAQQQELQDQIDEVNETSEGIGDIEADAWSDASAAITQLNLDTFVFDNDVIIGFTNTRWIFSSLWSALGVINQIFVVSMAMTVALLAIRYTKTRHGKDEA